MAEKAVAVHVFAAPDALCGQGQTWSAATSYIRARLHRRFEDRVVVEPVGAALENGDFIEDRHDAHESARGR